MNALSCLLFPNLIGRIETGTELAMSDLRRAEILLDAEFSDRELLLYVLLDVLEVVDLAPDLLSLSRPEKVV